MNLGVTIARPLDGARGASPDVEAPASARRPTRRSSTTTMNRLLDGTHYRVLGQLGRGGMGELFEATHARIGRRCVLKTLRSDLAHRHDLAARLENEGRILAALRGRGTPTLFDLDHLEDGRPFLVMERLTGGDLAARAHELGGGRAIDVVIDLLGVLEGVHEAGFVHRDLKLDNVFLTGSGRVVLIDFGIARRATDALRLTRQGVALGTPRSMAPERYDDHGGDARSDVYAVGLILYELLAGAGPFDDLGADPAALRAAHALRAPTPLRERGVLVGAAVDDVVARALAKEPADRFHGADEMREALLAARAPSMEHEDPATIESWGSVGSLDVDPGSWLE